MLRVHLRHRDVAVSEVLAEHRTVARVHRVVLRLAVPRHAAVHEVLHQLAVHLLGRVEHHHAALEVSLLVRCVATADGAHPVRPLQHDAREEVVGAGKRHHVAVHEDGLLVLREPEHVQLVEGVRPVRLGYASGETVYLHHSPSGLFHPRHGVVGDARRRSHEYQIHLTLLHHLRLLLQRLAKHQRPFDVALHRHNRDVRVLRSAAAAAADGDAGAAARAALARILSHVLPLLLRALLPLLPAPATTLFLLPLIAAAHQPVLRQRDAVLLQQRPQHVPLAHDPAHLPLQPAHIPCERRKRASRRVQPARVLLRATPPPRAPLGVQPGGRCAVRRVRRVVCVVGGGGRVLVVLPPHVGDRDEEHDAQRGHGAVAARVAQRAVVVACAVRLEGGEAPGGAACVRSGFESLRHGCC
eukprot:Rhum_TRINITY_DN11371_c0_g2::Rhum_TRINITY_DN11371_c0_g2_i1::g.44226::m.44226